MKSEKENLAVEETEEMVELDLEITEDDESRFEVVVVDKDGNKEQMDVVDYMFNTESFKDGMEDSLQFAGFYFGMISAGVDKDSAGGALALYIQKILEVQAVAELNEIIPKPL